MRVDPLNGIHGAGDQMISVVEHAVHVKEDAVQLESWRHFHRSRFQFYWFADRLFWDRYVTVR